MGSFPAAGRWAEWNGKYRDALRSYLKGDLWESENAAMRIAGSFDLYGTGGKEEEENGENGGRIRNYAGYNSCVNFLTCHDGFTLYDLYSYNEKHNEANGWNNTDGADDNRSWNCGVEGETQAAVPTRSITSQPTSPVMTCPLVSVTTAKVDAAVPVETPSWAFRAAIFWSTRSMMESMNVSFR